MATLMFYVRHWHDVSMELIIKWSLVFGHAKHWHDECNKDCVAKRMKVKSHQGKLPQQETELPFWEKYSG